MARPDFENPTVALPREVAWKKLSGDVFRKPKYPLILATLLGAGVQVFCTVLAVLANIAISHVGIVSQTK